MAQDAGKPLGKRGRRLFLKGGLSGLLLLPFRFAVADSPVISPAMSYAGARLLRRVDRQGMPDLRAEAFGPMTFFVFPVSVAAGPFDIYVADAGLSAVFRYDPALDAMMVVPGIRATQQTRLSAAPDGSVLVAEGRHAVAQRYSRNGRLMQTIDPLNTASRFDDILMDPKTGRYLGLDRVQRRIEEVHPLGRAGNSLPVDMLPLLPTAMALDDTILYAAGQDCGCVVAIDLFRRNSQVVVEDVVQVIAMAAGEGWLVVADNAQRLVRIYHNGVLRADPSYESLQLFNPQGLSIFRGMLYVADAGNRRIAAFRLRL